MSNGPAWLAASAGVGGAGAAWFAAINGVRTLKQTRADSIGRSRPMVAAEFQDAHPATAALYLVVRNHGPSVAKNVRVTFSPEIPDPPAEKAAQSLIPYLKERYARTIMTLTPGTELRNVYYIGKDGEDGEFSNAEDAPDRVTITINYQSADGKQDYEDSYDLDVALMQGETRITSSRSLDRQVIEIRKSLQSIDKRLGRKEGPGA